MMLDVIGRLKVELGFIEHAGATSLTDYSVLRDAIAEIERLRAGQFRWISPSERLPDSKRDVLMFSDMRANVGYYQASSEQWFNMQDLKEFFPHWWAEIPPLPEKTQESKDEELWDNLHQIQQFDHSENPVKAAFFEGLRAAREEKK